ALPGAESADGHIDYHERSLLHATAVGEQIAKLEAPVPAVPGRCVRGRELNLPAPKPDPTRLGEGVSAAADGRVVSKRDGVVFLVPGKSVDVVALWQHKGDVDLHSGHLHTRGSLLVTGDVHEQFKAEATGDVLVKGAVLSGIVRAGGAAVVDQAVQGAGSEVHAGGNLTCRHGNGALLAANGTVRMQEAVHCRVRGQDVELLRGRGKVVGGELRARHAIAVLAAGTEGGAETLLATADLTDQLAELVRLETAERAVQRQGQKYAHGDSGRSGKLTRAAVGTGDKAQAERLRHAERQRDLLREARIEVKGPLYPGVSVQFGQFTHKIDEPRTGVTFRWDATSNTIVEEQKQ
ncbi:MAG TPA: FapA family protein, partial [Planctomycetota bacterium]|nr:FapA family protein [Planctomycetota bacterium]